MPRFVSTINYLTNQKIILMYTLIEAKKETATSVFFQAEHNELETLHTIEVQKDQIQNYLEYCGQNFIPAHQIGNIKGFDITLDICQDIVRFGKDDVDYFVVGGTACVPTWNTATAVQNRVPYTFLKEGKFSDNLGSLLNRFMYCSGLFRGMNDHEMA